MIKLSLLPLIQSQSGVEGEKGNLCWGRDGGVVTCSRRVVYLANEHGDKVVNSFKCTLDDATT